MHAIEDESIPVKREVQEQIIAAMQKYLPGEATLFLLDYEMEIFMAEIFKRYQAG